jgi:hypothetical protein
MPIRWSILLLAGVIATALGMRAAAKEVTIQVKSFIRPMASADDPPGGPPSEATKKALGFDGLGQTRTDAYLFLLATDKMFSENPSKGDRGSGDFRLWSEVIADVVCQGNKVTNATFKGPNFAFGKEGALESVGEVARKLESKSADGVANFSYRIKGRPNNSSITAFTYVRPRNCTYIWHDVSGIISCSAGQPAAKVTLKASQFPSHKAWVADKVVIDMPQGPFENLWKCDPTDQTLVR